MIFCKPLKTQLFHKENQPDVWKRTFPCGAIGYKPMNHMSPAEHSITSFGSIIVNQKFSHVLKC